MKKSFGSKKMEKIKIGYFRIQKVRKDESSIAEYTGLLWKRKTHRFSRRMNV